MSNRLFEERVRPHLDLALEGFATRTDNAIAALNAANANLDNAADNVLDAEAARDTTVAAAAVVAEDKVTIAGLRDEIVSVQGSIALSVQSFSGDTQVIVEAQQAVSADRALVVEAKDLAVSAREGAEAALNELREEQAPTVQEILEQNIANGNPLGTVNFGQLRLFPRASLTAPTSSDATLDDDELTLSAGGRLFFNTNNQGFENGLLAGIKAGEAFGVSLLILEGDPLAPVISFYNNNTLVKAGEAMTPAGPYYIYEGDWPVEADALRVDVINFGEPEPFKMSWPLYAVAPSVALADVDSFKRGPAENIWPAVTTVSKITGNGPAPVARADGKFLVPDDTFSRISGAVSDLPIGTKLAWMVHANSENISYIAARHVGTSSEVFILDPLGDGWFGGVTTVGEGLSTVAPIKFLNLEVELREFTAAYDHGDILIDDINVYLSDRVPPSKPSNPVTVTANSGSGVSWVKSAGALTVYTRNASDTEDLRYVFINAVNASQDLEDWRWEMWAAGELVGGVFTVRQDLFAASEVSTAIKTEQASLLLGVDDGWIWGGEAHNQKLQDSLRFLVDGTEYTFETLPDEGSSASLNMIYNGVAHEERLAGAPRVEALRGQTQFKIKAGHLRKLDNVGWLKDQLAGPTYLAMCPVIAEGLTHVQIDATSYDMSTIAVNGVVTQAPAKNPAIIWLGEHDMVRMRAVHHSRKVSTLMQNRGTFWKGYFTISEGFGYEPKIAGERDFLDTIYEHSSF